MLGRDLDLLYRKYLEGGTSLTRINYNLNIIFNKNLNILNEYLCLAFIILCILVLKRFTRVIFENNIKQNFKLYVVINQPNTIILNI